MITAYKYYDNYAAISIDEYPCLDSPQVNAPPYEITFYDKDGEVVDRMGKFYELGIILDHFGISEKDRVGEYTNEDKLIIAILKKEI